MITDSIKIEHAKLEKYNTIVKGELIQAKKKLENLYSSEAHVLVDEELLAVGGRDARGLLAAVLQGVQTEVRELGHLFTGCPDAEDAAGVLWTAHGYLYLVYVAVAFHLAYRLRWKPVRTVLVLLAGTIPLMSFVAERRVTADLRRQEGQATGPAPAAPAPPA